MDKPPEPLTVPAALAALPVHDIPPFGPLVLHTDAARALGVGASTLRKWRSEGRFPQPVYKTPIASFYRITDLIAPYYRKHPEEEAAGLVVAPAALSVAPRPAVTGSADAVIERYAQEQQRHTQAVVEAVTEAVQGVRDSPSAVEAMAGEMAAQRAEIGRLGAELAEAREALQRESAWREKSLVDRALKR